MISIKASTLFLFMGAFSAGLTAQTAPATLKTTTTKTSTTTTVKAKAAAAATPATKTVTAKTTTTVAKKMPVKTTSTKTAPKATSTVKKTITATTAPKTSAGGTTAVTTTAPTQSTGGSIKTQTGIPNVNQAPGEQKTVGNKTSTTTPATTGTGTTTTTQTTTSGKPNMTGGTGSSTTTTTTTTTPTQTTSSGKPNMGGGSGNTTTTTTTSNNTGTDILSTITQGDASDAIKAALKLGVQAGVDKVSITDGFFGNSMIKIPFPSQVGQVESTLRSVGMGSLIDNAVLSMNRAAESAAKQAGPIFLNSITQMTVSDAVNIVGNQQPDAATQFLKRTTTESLVSSFKPSIKTALDATLATKYWGDITGYYNKIPFVSPINTDLPDYVTRKAIDGLFYMVAQEEAKIRKDPAGSASKVVSDVFSKVKAKF